MEIVNNYKANNTKFADIDEGVVFMYDGDPMMKMDEYLDSDGVNGVNAVKLENGETLWIKGTEKITIVNKAKLTIT